MQKKIETEEVWGKLVKDRARGVSFPREDGGRSLLAARNY
jgi:hypothetical protein